MKKALLPGLLSLVLFLIVFVHGTKTLQKVSAQTTDSISNHIVISEVQVASSSANDEFVELYNPTVDDVDLTGWRLSRETKNGATTSANLVSSMSGTIKAHGYFLITPQSGYTGSVSADLKYSTGNVITSNNTVLLYSSDSATLVDKVGMGQATDFETATTVNPGPGQSVERKANALSTQISMGAGGSDEFSGNGEDTDDNMQDFILRASSQPQNSSSFTEVPIAQTPTITETPIDIPTETPTDIPTITPTMTVSPTQVPSITVTPSPTQNPFQSGHLVCTLQSRTVKIKNFIFNFSFTFDIPVCKFTKN